MENFACQVNKKPTNSMDHIIGKNGTFKLCGIIRVIDGFVFKLLSACQVAEETK